MARLRFLGGAQVEPEDDKASPGVTSSRRHPLALLALLACAPSRTLSRPKLAGLLWPERPEAAARNRLNTCVYNVRRALGTEAIITSGEDVRLGDRIACDVLELREAAATGEAARVAALYRGPLLDGFYLSGTPEFEQWLDAQREALRRVYLESVEQLALEAMEGARLSDAARHWQTLVREEPWDARLAMRLVEALEAAGNTGAALRAGEAHIRTMADTFGREPRADLVSLLERIRRGDSGPGRRPTDVADTASPRTSRPGGVRPHEAQVSYARGRGHLDERTESGLLLAAAHFQAAIELDQDYAAAWAGLADALHILRFYDYAAPENAPPPLEAARRALDVDSDCGEGWSALGIGHAVRQEGPEATRALERAIEILPSHAEAYAWLAWVHLMMGRPDQAVDMGTRATEIDPLAPPYRAYLAEEWLANGDAERAYIEARRAVEIQPGYGLARFILALVEYHRGNLGAAQAALEGARAGPSRGRPRHAEIAALEALAEDRKAAVRTHLARLEAAPLPVRDPGSIGVLYAALGDLDAAFDAFGQVDPWRDFAVENVRYFFPDVLEPLRADPRFVGLLANVNAAWGVG